MGCHFCSGGNQADLSLVFVSAPPERAWIGGGQPVCLACQAEHAKVLATAADEFFFGGM